MDRELEAAILARKRDAGQEAYLRRWVAEHLKDEDCEHRFPEVHRITDVRVEGMCFRILRCVTCGEIWAFGIGEEICFEGDVGVPLGLEGEAMEKWLVEARRKHEEETGWR